MACYDDFTLLLMEERIAATATLKWREGETETVAHKGVDAGDGDAASTKNRRGSDGDDREKEEKRCAVGDGDRREGKKK